MTHTSSFDIQTPDDFFTKIVVPQYEDFKGDNGSSRKALIAIIVAYHMFEWANNRKTFAKNNSGLPSNINDLFETARKITNGTKHFEQKICTKVQGGFSSDFSDAFQRPLIIVLDEEPELSVDKLLGDMIEYWEKEKADGKF
jgi:hypothetical protein